MTLCKYCAHHVNTTHCGFKMKSFTHLESLVRAVIYVQLLHMQCYSYRYCSDSQRLEPTLYEVLSIVYPTVSLQDTSQIVNTKSNPYINSRYDISNKSASLDTSMVSSFMSFFEKTVDYVGKTQLPFRSLLSLGIKGYVCRCHDSYEKFQLLQSYETYHELTDLSSSSLKLEMNHYCISKKPICTSKSIQSPDGACKIFINPFLKTCVWIDRDFQVRNIMVAKKSVDVENNHSHQIIVMDTNIHTGDFNNNDLIKSCSSRDANNITEDSDSVTDCHSPTNRTEHSDSVTDFHSSTDDDSKISSSVFPTMTDTIIENTEAEENSTNTNVEREKINHDYLQTNKQNKFHTIQATVDVNVSSLITYNLFTPIISSYINISDLIPEFLHYNEGNEYWFNGLDRRHHDTSTNSHHDSRYRIFYDFLTAGRPFLHICLHILLVSIQICICILIQIVHSIPIYFAHFSLSAILYWFGCNRLASNAWIKYGFLSIVSLFSYLLLLVVSGYNHSAYRTNATINFNIHHKNIWSHVYILSEELMDTGLTLWWHGIAGVRWLGVTSMLLVPILTVYGYLKYYQCNDSADVGYVYNDNDDVYDYNMKSNHEKNHIYYDYNYDDKNKYNRQMHIATTNKSSLLENILTVSLRILFVYCVVNSTSNIELNMLVICVIICYYCTSILYDSSILRLIPNNGLNHHDTNDDNGNKRIKNKRNKYQISDINREIKKSTESELKKLQLFVSENKDFVFNNMKFSSSDTRELLNKFSEGIYSGIPSASS